MPDQIKSAIDAQPASSMREVIVEELIRAKLSDIEIEKYKEIFDDWYELNSNRLREIHSYQTRKARSVLIAFDIVNGGRQPAENVIIKLSIGSSPSICDLESTSNFYGVLEPPHPWGEGKYALTYFGPTEIEYPVWYQKLNDFKNRWLNDKKITARLETR
jgi:hypothetical protein